jgi:hypothetical protein
MRLAHDCLVLDFRLEEPERIRDDDRVGALVSEWQHPHIAANPGDVRTRLACKLSCSTQETVGEIDAYDPGAALRKRKRVPAVATTDIDDASGL